MKKIKKIAIVAFESKKTDLIEWSYFNRNLLTPHQILALGIAGNILEGTLNKKISTSGKSGEYRELCSLINTEKIDAVIIFGEPNEILENKDLSFVLEAVIHQNIVVATNRSTADFILHSSLLGIEYTIHKEEKNSTENKESLKTSSSYTLAKAS